MDHDDASLPAARIVVVPDSFKGTFSSPEVAAAIAAGIRRAGLRADVCPAADGGEGTLDALLSAGGVAVEVPVHDPLGRPIVARLGLLDAPAGGSGGPDPREDDRGVPRGDDHPQADVRDDQAAGPGRTAVIEMAQASGLGLVAPEERDAERASTRGTGELIAAAVARGARELLVTVGGSATSDGGAGAIAAIAAAGGLRGARMTVLCDVTTPFERAAVVYGAQKGADPAAIARLTARLEALAATLPRDPRGVPMTGAAGGLSGGLWAAFDAELVVGAERVLDVLGLDRLLAGAGAVVTGEGRLDGQTAAGKLIDVVARRAAAAGLPVDAIVGRSELGGDEAHALGLRHVLEASTRSEIEDAGAALAGLIAGAAARRNG